MRQTRYRQLKLPKLLSKFQYIPHYISPGHTKRALPEYGDALKVAVHVHLTDSEPLDLVLERLKNASQVSCSFQ